MTKRIVFILGARPNLVKSAPVYHALRALGVEPQLIYTGQHSSDSLFGNIKEQFALPDGVQLGLSSTNTGRIDYIGRLASILVSRLRVFSPERVVVFGDVNSSYAGALAAHQAGIEIAHVEAGLRSGDLTMPEEWNRIGIDRLAKLCFTTESSGTSNLIKEGHQPQFIHQCGNTMIDTLNYYLPKAKTIAPLRLPPFIWMSMHRPGNIDAFKDAQKVVECTIQLATFLPVLWPMHPRTHERLSTFGLLHRLTAHPRITISQPLDYLTNLAQMSYAALLVTDSGGVQEEAVALGKHCITLRSTTERPVTISCGSNTLMPDFDPDTLLEVVQQKYHSAPSITIPEYWDGHAARRIAHILLHK